MLQLRIFYKYILVILFLAWSSLSLGAIEDLNSGDSKTIAADLTDSAANPTVTMEGGTSLTINSGITVDHTATADIVIKNDGAAAGAVTITNSGTITSLAAGNAIDVGNAVATNNNLALTNAGTITDPIILGGTGNHSITNNTGGDIQSPIDFTAGGAGGAATGNNTITLNAGNVDAITFGAGNTGTNTLNFKGGHFGQNFGAVTMGGGTNIVNASTLVDLNGNFTATGAKTTINIAHNGSDTTMLDFNGVSPTFDAGLANIVMSVSYPQKVSTGTLTYIDVVGGTLAATGGAPNLVLPSNTATLTFSNPQYTVGLNGTLTVDVVASSISNISTTTAAAPVASILDSVRSSATGDFATVLNSIFGLSTAESVSEAMTQLPPNPDSIAPGSLPLADAISASGLARLDLARVNMHDMQTSGYVAGDDSDGRGIWAKVFGGSGRQKARGDYNGYNSRVYGMTLGADRSILDDKGRAGLGFSYGDTKIKPKHSNGSRSDVHSYQMMIYGNYERNKLLWDGVLSGGLNKTKSRRRMVFTGINRTATADYNGYQVAGRLRCGYKFNPEQQKRFEIIPTATVQATRASNKKYTEKGADSINLRDVKSSSINDFKAGVGIRTGYVPDPLSNYKIYPSAHFHYLHDFTKERGLTHAAFSGGGGFFETEGLKPTSSNYNLGASLNIAINKDLYFIAEYDAHLKKKYINHSGSLSFRYML